MCAPDEASLRRAFNTTQPVSLTAGTPVTLRCDALPGTYWNFQDIRCIRAAVNATGIREGVIRVRWHVQTMDGSYATTTSAAVSTGTAAVVEAHLSSDGELIPDGHQRPFDEQSCAEITALELEATFMTAKRDAGSPALTISDFALIPRAVTASTPRLLDVALYQPGADTRAAYVLEFRIDPEPHDPFECEGAGDVRIRCGGEETLAYLHQHYSPAEDGSAQRARAVALPRWRAYLAKTPGTAPLEIVAGKQRWKIPAGALQALPFAVEPPAYVRQRWISELEVHRDASAASGPAWQFSQGKWTPVARNSIGTGPFIRPMPFWSSAWSGFFGISKPNQSLAQNADALLAQSALSRRPRPLLVFDGATLQCEGMFNWLSHPLRDLLSVPSTVLHTTEGENFTARWLRYSLARWGMSRGISEICVDASLTSPYASGFHETLAKSLAALPHSREIEIYSLNPMTCAPEVLCALHSAAGERVTYGPFVPENQNVALSDGMRDLDAPIANGEILELTNGATRALGAIAKFVLPNPEWNKPAPDNFSCADALTFDVYIPSSAPSDLRVGIHLRDRDALWFETLLPGMIRPGDWTTYTVDLTGRNADRLQGLGHKKTWSDYSRQRISEVGIHVYSTHANPSAPLTAEISELRAVRFARSGDPSAPTFSLVNESAAASVLNFGALWECHFTCSKTFANPFDPESCDLCAVITTPSGKTVRAPAFLNQNCERREAANGSEVVEPIGEEFFTVRYRPDESGVHAVSLELREGGKYEVTTTWTPDSRFDPDGNAQTAINFTPDSAPIYPNSYPNGKRRIDQIRFVPGTVTSTLKLQPFQVSARTAQSTFHGSIRTAADKRHFEFSDGAFYYPLGPNLRGPSDTRLAYGDKKWTELPALAVRGTRQFDDYFAEFKKNGMNWARVWMCSWWCSLEWRRDWPGYQGVGRYNLLNAWRMDYLLEQAEKNQICLELTLTNHGQYSVKVDSEWKDSPLNCELGGPFRTPSEVMTRAEGKIALQNRLRYTLARFGHSPAIMAWELISEMDWTEEYGPSNRGWTQQDLPAPNLCAWHSEMAAFLKSYGPHRHLVSTHVADPKRCSPVFALPEIDISTSNAYSTVWPLGKADGNAAAAIADYWGGNGDFQGFHVFGKPSIIQEQGRHWEGVDPSGKTCNTKKQLDAELHTELWSSVVQPLGGATGYWWWLHLHLDNRYFEYKALSNFIAGEDMRAAAGETMLEPVCNPLNDGLVARAFRSNRRLYAWIYHNRLPYGEDVPSVANASMRISSLLPGTYTAELWDTRSGMCIKTEELTIGRENGETVPATLTLPTIAGDLALKVKPKK